VSRRADGSERRRHVWSAVSSSRQAGDSVVSSLRQRQTRSLDVVCLHGPLRLRRAARLACALRSTPTYFLFICIDSSVDVPGGAHVRKTTARVTSERCCSPFSVSPLSEFLADTFHVFADDRVTDSHCIG